MVKLKDRNIVKKKNDLILGKEDLTLMEKKFLLLIIAQIDKEDQELKEYKVSILDLKEKLGIEGELYSKVYQMSKKLMKKTIEIKKPDSDEWEMYVWCPTMKYKKGELTCKLNEDLKPFLLDLKKNFTKYNLKYVLGFKSAYSIKLYELLKTFEYVGEKEFLLEELQDIFKVPKSLKVYGDFKRKTLNVARAEINLKSDLNIEFKEIKKGKKVVAIKFLINKADETKNKAKLKEYIKLCDCPEQQKKELKQVLIKHLDKDEDVITSNIQYANNSDASNYIAYLTKALQNDYAKNSRELMKQLEVEDMKELNSIKKFKKEAEECFKNTGGNCGVLRYGSEPSNDVCRACPGYRK